MHDLRDVFWFNGVIREAVFKVKCTNTSEVGGVDIFNMKIAGLCKGECAVGILMVSVGVNIDTTTSKPGDTINVKVGMLGTFLIGEVLPKSVNEPTNRASGFVEVNNMVRNRKIGVSFIFGRSAI